MRLFARFTGFSNTLNILKLDGFKGEQGEAMGYHIEDVYFFTTSIEHEVKYCADHTGAREKRKKASPEQIKKQNQWNREKYMRRLIKANFKEGDLFVTLKYPRGAKPSMDGIEADFKRFLDGMRRRYHKQKTAFKWAARVEMGAKGGSHIHILMNNVKNTALWVKQCWKPGKQNIEPCDNIRLNDLGSYMTKLPDEDIEGQMSFLSASDRKKYVKFRSSKNLVRPETIRQRERVSRKEIVKLLKDGPKAREGYYIDKNSIRHGVNKYTGYGYYYYTEVKLEKAQTDREKEKPGLFECLKEKARSFFGKCRRR